MTTTGDDLVWYAAYGSNLWTPRFLAYLTGGPVPHSPTGRVQAGAADATPPRADRPAMLEGSLFFARSSPGWAGGGVAFLDPAPPTEPAQRTGATCYGRLWLVTWEQFVEVTAQENGRPVAVDRSARSELAASGHLDVSDGWYGRMVQLGAADDGRPVLTITCPDPAGIDRQGPHRSYLRVVGLGLLETWGLAPAEAARYLAAAHHPGAGVDVDSVADDLARSRSERR